MSDYKDYGYNTSEWSHIHQYLLEPIVEILSARSGRKILDVGCGNGWMTNHLVELGYDAYGTDASESGIAIAKAKNPDRFFLQDLTQNDLPDALKAMDFNTIISTEVIEHLYSPREYLDFCKRVLQKSGGGELIVSTPYHGYLKNLVLSVTGKMDKHLTVLWDGGHIKFWSRDTLTRILEERGFSKITFTGCGRVPFIWKSMIISGRI
jgi:2-polyprenyl-3-methyl-5-hydroxy-6-metoxy-1,4-benzoquinol methylase